MCGIIETIIGSFFLKMKRSRIIQTLINKKKIGSILSRLPSRNATINIVPSILVYIHYSNPVYPSIGRNMRFLSLIQKRKYLGFSIVEIQFGRHKISGKKKIFISVIIKISNSYPRTIVHIYIIKNV